MDIPSVSQGSTTARVFLLVVSSQCVAVSAHLSDFEPNVNHCRLDPTGWDVCPELQLLPFSLGLALLTPKGRAVDPKLLLQKGSLQDRRATTATATASGEACALGLH